jgi:hypothetical protein
VIIFYIITNLCYNKFIKATEKGAPVGDVKPVTLMPERDRPTPGSPVVEAVRTFLLPLKKLRIFS